MLDSERLDRLADAFHAHGIPVRDNLLPGATDAELDEVAAQLGVDLPQEYRDLYRWSAGSRDHETGPRLVFRDMAFLPLSLVVEHQRAVVETYATGMPEGESATELYGIDLARTAPIAELMGSTLVVACGWQRLTDRSHPVVNAFQGIDVFFHSVGSMIDTCIEWVDQADYDAYAPAPNEMAIWQRHNPGVFG